MVKRPILLSVTLWRTSIHSFASLAPLYFKLRLKLLLDSAGYGRHQWWLSIPRGSPSASWSRSSGRRRAVCRSCGAPQTDQSYSAVVSSCHGGHHTYHSLQSVIFLPNAPWSLLNYAVDSLLSILVGFWQLYRMSILCPSLRYFFGAKFQINGKETPVVGSVEAGVKLL